MKTFNQKGFSLIEVMIAGGLAAGLMLGIATMTTNMNKGLKGVQRTADGIDLRDAVRGSLRSESQCVLSMSLGTGLVYDTLTPSTLNAQNVQITVNSRVVTVDSLWGGVRVTGLTMSNLVSVGASHHGTLTIRVSTNKSATSTAPEVMGAQDFEYTFKIAFYPTSGGATNILNKCISAESDIAEINTNQNNAQEDLSDLLARIEALELWATNPTNPLGVVRQFSQMDLEINGTTTVKGLSGRIQELEEWSANIESQLQNTKTALNNRPVNCIQKTGDTNPPNGGGWSGGVARCDGQYPNIKDSRAWGCTQNGDIASSKLEVNEFGETYLHVRCYDPGAGGAWSKKVLWSLECCETKPSRVP